MTHDEPEYDDRRPEIQWRHLRTAITLLLLVGVMVAAAYFGWQRVTGDDEDEATAEPCVPSTAAAIPENADVEINVFNATSRSGLAGDVADQMRERGFVVAEVANDPLDREIAGTAEVRGNESQQGAAALLTATVPEAEFVPDDRDVNTLDVVLGEAFNELAAADAPPPEPPASDDECAAPSEEPTDPAATDGA